MAQNSPNNSNSWLIQAGATITALVVTGYLAYGYSTEWKGAAYSFWFPKTRRLRKVKSPFHAQVDQESKTLDIDARAWMELYVRTTLKKTDHKSQKK